MGRRIEAGELRRRAVAGNRAEVEAFAGAAPDSRLIRPEDLPEDRGHAMDMEAPDLARTRGLATASLQASGAGAGIYERLGFADRGFVEMWELRR